MKRTVRFPLKRGIIAAPAHAWGEEFSVVIPDAKRKPFTEAGPYAVVTIDGPLEQHSHWLCDSYDDIKSRCAAAFGSTSPRVCLRINSPGGDFPGSVELSRELRALADATGKPFVAFTDSQALSAGYALACAADEIVITDSAFVGSIGVWAALVDETALDKAMGRNIVIVPSGERKVDRNPHVAITESAVAAMQAEVDLMAGLFFDLVSEHRSLARASVESLQGGMHFGTSAINIGLADRKVSSWEAFISEKGNVMKFKAGEDNEKAIDEALASMRGIEGDDDDAKKAKKALRAKAKKALQAMEDEDGGKSEDGEGEGEKEAKAADDDEKAKASEGDEKKDEEKAKAKAGKSPLKLVASASARELEFAERLHALEVERAEEKETAEKQALLSKRPDFAPEVRASLESAPLDFVRKACKNWKRGADVAKAGDVIAPTATRGDTQGANVPTTEAAEKEAAFIKEKMGYTAAGNGVAHTGRVSTFGFMTPEQVNAAAIKLGVKGGA